MASHEHSDSVYRPANRNIRNLGAAWVYGPLLKERLLDRVKDLYSESVSLIIHCDDICILVIVEICINLKLGASLVLLQPNIYLIQAYSKVSG